MTDSERERHQELAIDVKEKSAEALSIIENLCEKYQGNETNDGISFLDLKNLLMVDYLTNVTYLMLRKSFGKTISGEESIERLVEIRTVLEKMRPIEKKLKYQIDKYVKVAESDNIPENDPLLLRPNVEALDGESTTDDDGHEESVDGVKKYVAPRHVPTYFNQDENPELAEREKSEKIKKHLLSRGLIDELKIQHLDTPEEVFDLETMKQSRQAAIDRERTRYEEENFMRLPVTKKDKKERRKRQLGMTIGRLGDELTHDFGKSRFDDSPGSSMKKRKKSSFKKSSAKKKFRRK